MLTPLENQPRGGADTWDDGNAGALLTAEVFDGGEPEYFSGGASASVSVSAFGAGVALERVADGSSATVEVTAAGEGIQVEEGPPPAPAPEPGGGGFIGGARGRPRSATRKPEAFPMWLPPGPTGPTEAELEADRRAERLRRQRKQIQALLLCGALGGLH